MSKKSTRVEKVLNILEYLSFIGGSALCSDMTRELGISKSTLNEILNFLKDQGYVNIEKDKGVNKYRLEKRVVWQDRILDPDEVQAVQFCTDMCSELLFGGRQEKAWKGLRKYYQNMSRDSEHVVGSKMRHSFKGRVDYSDKSKILDVLFDSLSLQKWVHIDYKKINSDRAVGYKIMPVDIIVQNNALYLDAVYDDPRSPERKRRSFAVCRIYNAELCKDRFKNGVEPERKCLYGLNYGPAIDVKVRYDKFVKIYVEERVWGENMVYDKEQDGSFTLSFKTASKLELESWVLSFGEHMECLEPLECREHIKKRMGAALNKYT